MRSRVQQYLAANRAALELDMRDSRNRRYVSPVLLGLHRELQPRILHLARGRFLDAGCGAMPFRKLLETRVSHYDALDIAPRVSGASVLADLRALPFEAGSYDGVLCSEVLEHVSDPRLALRELHRVIRRGGNVVLSVPFLARLHDEPHDYFRYTRHGLRHLLTEAGFRVIEIVPTSGVLSFLGHQVSTVLLTSLYALPVLRHLALGVNTLFVTLPCYWLDRVSRLAHKLPAGYVAVAAKD